MRHRLRFMAALLSLSVVTATVVVSTVPASAVTCEDSCGGGGGGGGGGGVGTQTIGQSLTAIIATTNTGATCTFGFPVVTTTFATRSSTWTASVQCTEQMSDISGKTVFDTCYFPGQAIACSNDICGGVLPDFGPRFSVTVSGSAQLAPSVNYGVQSEIAVTAPPGQSFVTSPIVTNGTFFFCTPDSVNNSGFTCWLDTGPFSAP